MSPLHLRPEGLRLPWQALVVVAVIVYAVESALRGWDFTPDALDLIVFGLFAIVIVVRPLAARFLRDEDDVEDADRLE